MIFSIVVALISLLLFIVIISMLASLKHQISSLHRIVNGDREDEAPENIGLAKHGLLQIPKLIHMIIPTNIEITDELQTNLQNWKLQNPDMKLQLWTKQLYSDISKKINDGNAKFVIPYLRGGWYVDYRYKAGNKSLSTIILEPSNVGHLVTFKDPAARKPSLKTVELSVFGACAGNALLSQVIEQSAKRGLKEPGEPELMFQQLCDENSNECTLVSTSVDYYISQVQL